MQSTQATRASVRTCSIFLASRSLWYRLGHSQKNRASGKRIDDRKERTQRKEEYLDGIAHEFLLLLPASAKGLVELHKASVFVATG